MFLPVYFSQWSTYRLHRKKVAEKIEGFVRSSAKEKLPVFGI
jgi:hypothetical protein